jgi:hypothetical protein
MKNRLTAQVRHSSVLAKTSRFSIQALLAFTLASCGAEPDSRFESSDAQGLASRDKLAKPPKAYYDSLLADRMQLANSGLLNASDEAVLWLNFAGATVTKGTDLGQSFLLCKNQAKIPSSSLSFDTQQEITQQVATYFSNAGAKLNVTTDQPLSGDYTTIHVGGTAADLGCNSSGFLAGMAPFDVGNANPSDIGFVFPQTSDVSSIARAIAHEAGHTYGLDHSDNKNDLMYPWDLQSAVGFATGITSSTKTMQDPAALLQMALGVGQASVSGIPVLPTLPVPAVNFSQAPLPSALANIPNHLSSLPGLSNFASLNAMVGSMPTAISGLVGCVIPPISVNGMPINVALQNSQGALGLLTVLMNASMGQNAGQFNMLHLVGLVSGYPTMNISQMISLAGISLSATQCLTQLVPVNLPGITASLPGQLQTGVNVAQILAMNNVNNPGQLIAMIPQYAQVINATSQGSNAQALMTLVLMGVAQQYMTLP